MQLLWNTYGWCLNAIPTRCVCGRPFRVDHTLNCLKGDFLTKLSHVHGGRDVWVEPHLQPLTGEDIEQPAQTQKPDLTSVPVVGITVWESLHGCACLQWHEQEKKRQYDQCTREVEHASFSPLVFSTSGGISKSTSIAYKRLAHQL